MAVWHEVVRNFERYLVVSMSDERADTAFLLKAIEFASRKHSTQRRKNKEASPYINHPIAVAHLLADTGGITDLVTLMAAVLHDTIEDTETTPAELDEQFGEMVRKVVEEMTDDKSLAKAERKRLQIEHAPRLSRRAKAIKLADKIANLQDVVDNPPANWPLARRIEYLDWTEKVVAGVRGTNVALEKLYDQLLEMGRVKFEPDPIGGKSTANS
jgi:(p)ppGpp synthase/HD superfamily hydrolase